MKIRWNKRERVVVWKELVIEVLIYRHDMVEEEEKRTTMMMMMMMAAIAMKKEDTDINLINL